jgi:regulator of protease activity HflC (stomatin/prohibitin superfamily)
MAKRIIAGCALAAAAASGLGYLLYIHIRSVLGSRRNGVINTEEVLKNDETSLRPSGVQSFDVNQQSSVHGKPVEKSEMSVVERAKATRLMADMLQKVVDQMYYIAEEADAAVDKILGEEATMAAEIAARAAGAAAEATVEALAATQVAAESAEAVMQAVEGGPDEDASPHR